MLLEILATIADKAKGTGYLVAARTVKRFYKSLGRSIADKVHVPSQKARLPEILTDV